MRPGFLLLLLLGASVAGCGEGDVVPCAQLVIAGTEGTSISRVLDAVHGLLGAEGFDDLGKYDEMIDLLKHTNGSEREITMNEREIALFEHQYTYLNDARLLRVVVTDYTDPQGPVPSVNYEKPDGPFIDISVYEERPGGFSEAGHRFLDTFQASVENLLGRSVTLVTPPPPTDDAEYRRITRINNVTRVVWWLLTIGLTLAITGPLSVYFLKRIAAPLSMKRCIFALITTWLVTPLPFQAAFIMVIPAPNLIAFPWTDLDYYHRIREFAVVSFPCALVVCTLVALFSLRKQGPQKQ